MFVGLKKISIIGFSLLILGGTKIVVYTVLLRDFIHCKELRMFNNRNERKGDKACLPI